MNFRKKIVGIPFVPLYISGTLSLVTVLTVTVWSHLQPPAAQEDSRRAIASIYASSVSGEKQLPEKFRRNPAFRLFQRIEKAIEAP